MKKTVFSRKHAPISSHWILAAICLLSLSFPQLGWAADRTKANNADNLNLSTSWVGGEVPGSGDVGVWDDTVTGSNATVLGSDLSWQGIRVGGTTQTGTITISTGNTLTLGTAGIDMSSAPRNLTPNPAITIGATQDWNVVTGRLLSASGVISSSIGNGVTKTGAGTLGLFGSNSLAGDFTIDAGRINFFGGGFNGGGALILNNGITIANVGGGVGNIARATTIAGNIILDNSAGTSSTTSIVFSQATTLTGNREIRMDNAVNANGGGNASFTGGIGDGGNGYSLTKTGPGELRLGSTQSTYTGGTFVNGGTLTIASSNLSSTGVVEINNGSTLNVAFNSVIGALTLNDGSVTGSASFGLRASSYTMASGTVSKVLDQSVAGVTLTKTTAGTVTLSAANLYTGGTTVSAGTLLVTNTTGSATGTGAVTVDSAGILGGDGIITGATTISGSLRPGNSIGTLTIENDVTWNAGNDWVFELGTAGASLAAPGTSDLLNLTGASSDFLKGTGTGWTFDFAGSGETGWYRLVDWTGTTGFTGTDFTGINLASGLSVGSFVVDSSTSALYLQVIPEPSTVGIIVLALGIAGIRALRRKRRTA